MACTGVQSVSERGRDHVDSLSRKLDRAEVAELMSGRMVCQDDVGHDRAEVAELCLAALCQGYPAEHGPRKRIAMM